MWDDLLRMEGSSSAGRQYHLCILRRWTIQHYKALQRSTIVSLQDRERWHEAIDKNVVIEMMMMTFHGLTSSSSCQSIFPMVVVFLLLSAAEKNSRAPGSRQNYFCQTQLSPCPSLPPPFSFFKVCVSHVLLAMEPCDGASSRLVCTQQHPECYAQRGSASGEEKGK